MLELLRVDLAAKTGADLDVLHYTPDRPTKSMVLLIPGLSGPVLSGRHDYRPLARELNARGYGLMLLNMRSANTFWYATFEDCAEDINEAVKMAQSIGYEDVALFGTSLGGPRVVYTMAHQPPAAVRVLGILAAVKSMYEEAQLRMTPAALANYEATLAKARALVKEGKPYEGVTAIDYFPGGRHMTMQAHSFLSFFGAPNECDASTVKFGDRIKVPTLVMHSKADELILPANGQAIYDSLTSAPSREMIWLEGAAHYMVPGWIAEAYAKNIAAWVANQMPLRS
jgi:esterase/lipase